MTHAIGHTVHLTDLDCVEVSNARRQRIVRDIQASLSRHIPGADPREVEDAARNLAQAWGVLGAVNGPRDGRDGASER